MKNLFKYFLICSFIIPLTVACDDDDLDNTSIFENIQVENDFDRWLLREFVYPYNIDIKYRMEDIESDINYDLVPARYDKSVELAILIKHLWLEPYDELVGIDFTRSYIPKVIHFIGSNAYNPNNTVTLGVAEGGLKVTLNAVNDLVIDKDVLLNDNSYFHTMHHEFAHIFHQTINYNPDFKLVTEGKYVSGSWNLQGYAGQGLVNGFISDYARYSADEDFVEIYAFYILSTAEQWDARLASAGTEGAAIINEKLVYVKEYMLNTWGLDMDKMRAIVLRRANEILDLDYDIVNDN